VGVGLGGLAWAVGIWAVTTVLTLLIAAMAVATLPETYFRDQAMPAWPVASGRWRRAGRVGRNLLGVVLVLVGAVLSIPGVPGQGLLTLLAGGLLLDFPGRRRVLRAIVRRPGVLPAVNRLRRRLGRPPLLPPAPDAP
jgi:hypothetical protein